jgi:hypothetical protein
MNYLNINITNSNLGIKIPFKKFKDFKLIKIAISSNFKESQNNEYNFSLDDIKFKYNNEEIINVLKKVFLNEDNLFTAKQIYLGFYIETYLISNKSNFLDVIDKFDYEYNYSLGEWKYFLSAWNLSRKFGFIWNNNGNGYKILKNFIKITDKNVIINYINSICNNNCEYWTILSEFKEYLLDELLQIDDLKESFIISHLENPDIPNKNYAFPNEINICDYIYKNNNISDIWQILSKWCNNHLGDYNNFPWNNNDYINCVIAGGSIVNAAKNLITNQDPPENSDIDIFIFGEYDLKKFYNIYKQNYNYDEYNKSNLYLEKILNFIKKNNEIYNKENNTNHKLVIKGIGSSIIKIYNNLWKCYIQIIITPFKNYQKVLENFDMDYVKCCIFNNNLFFTPECVRSWITCCITPNYEIAQWNYFLKNIDRNFKECCKGDLITERIIDYLYYDNYKNIYYCSDDEKLLSIDITSYNTRIENTKSDIELIKKNKFNKDDSIKLIHFFDTIFNMKRICKSYLKGFGFTQKPIMVKWIGKIEYIIDSIKNNPSNNNFLPDLYNGFTIGKVHIKNKIILDEKMLQDKDLLNIIISNIKIDTPFCYKSSGNLFNSRRKTLKNNFLFANKYLNIVNIKTYIPYMDNEDIKNCYYNLQFKFKKSFLVQFLQYIKLKIAEFVSVENKIFEVLDFKPNIKYPSFHKENLNIYPSSLIVKKYNNEYQTKISLLKTESDEYFQWNQWSHNNSLDKIINSKTNIKINKKKRNKFYYSVFLNKSFEMTCSVKINFFVNFINNMSFFRINVIDVNNVNSFNLKKN